MYRLKMRRADSSSGEENKFGTEQSGVEKLLQTKRKKIKGEETKNNLIVRKKGWRDNSKKGGRSRGGRAVPSSVFCPGCSFIVIPDDHSQQCCSSACSPKHPSHQSPSILPLVSLSLLQPRAPHLCPAAAAAGDGASIRPAAHLHGRTSLRNYSGAVNTSASSAVTAQVMFKSHGELSRQRVRALLMNRAAVRLQLCAVGSRGSTFNPFDHVVQE